MLNRFEIKTAVGTFIAALLCFLFDAHLSGGANWMTWLGPFVVAGVSAASAFVFARRPLQQYMAAKREQKTTPIITQFDSFNKMIDDLVAVRLGPMKTELATARADLADYVAKEVELNLIHRIDDELQNVHITDQAMERIIKAIRDDMGEYVTAAVAFRQSTKDELGISASWGIEEQHRKALLTAVTRAIPSIISAPAPLLWARADAAHLQHAVPGGSERIMIVPLKGSYQFIGCLMLCINSDKEPTVSRTMRTMKKVGEHSSRLLYRIALAEEREENRRRDKLTLAWNRQTLQEKLLEMTSAEGATNLSLLLIEGDNFISLNQAIGRDRGDDLIKALADTIKSNIKASRTSNNIESAFYRTGAAQFGLLLEDYDETQLYQVSERIRTAVSQRSGWPGEVAQWTVSIGAATQTDGQPSQLLSSSEDALAYLKSQQSPNKILFANQLPAKFRRMRSNEAGVTGDLKVFDPGELLQSVNIARNSGILRVTADAENEFWAFFSEGQLKKAKLGRLRGDAAVVEFICMFEQGNFRFVEAGAADGGADDPRALGNTYDTSDLGKLLMDGALAKDNYAQARAKIPNTELYVIAAPEQQRKDMWEKLKASSNPPTTTDRSIMEEMLKLCGGSLKLKQVFQKLETYPTAWLLHCAAMLLESQYIRLTAIKTYSHV